MAVTTDVSAALLLCRAEFSLLFFSPITLPSLHCSREFSGAVVAGVVREQLRVCTAHLLFFFFYNSISRLYNPQEFQGRIWYKPATFAVRSVALRRTIVDGVKHKPPAPGLSPPQLPHALACVFFLGRKKDYLVRPPFYAVIRGTGWERTAVAGFVT